MKTFSELKKNLKKDFTGTRPVKVALLGDTATQLLNQAIRAAGWEHGLDLTIWEADFNQMENQVLNPSSGLYGFDPEIVILFRSAHKLLERYNKGQATKEKLAETELAAIGLLCSSLEKNSTAAILFYNYTEIDNGVFGNFSNKLEHSFLFQLRKLNYELMVMASQKANLHICDLSSVQNLYGKKNLFDTSLYINTEMVLSLDLLPVVAERTAGTIAAMNGAVKKCLVLDLDNTLWSGVIGDDGMENIQIGQLGIGKAFTEFQYWIKQLKERGILLAVCSKNTEAIAKEPFEDHPDMVLSLDDIAVFIANWENKVDNIRQVQQVLDIGFDSMVFLDDNPFERNMVRENIPCLTVPELPEDPADFLEYLYALNLFETVTYSEEDAKRTAQYQAEAKRTVVYQKFGNEEAFLESLGMVSAVAPFTRFNIPRVAQLAQRSNQFNLRTIRYMETDIEQMAKDADVFPFTFTLEDKFGDNGLVCVVILKKENAQTLFIDTWFMSCRVLKRGMEQFVCNTIADFAERNGFNKLKGEYIPTRKNGLVKDLYGEMGFREENGYWWLNVQGRTKQNVYITAKEQV